MELRRAKDIAIGAVIATIVLGASPTVFAKVSQMDIPVSFNNIKIVIDGQELKTDKEPFIYEGTTYLPVRAVGEAVGKTVGWDGNTNTVTLKTADTSGTKQEQQTYTLGAGNYVVGEDIAAGKYDCVAESGSGNFIGKVASLGIMGLNEILGAEGTYFEDNSEYNNLNLADGDTITIKGDLKVKFIPE